jgi:predicted RNA-binding protein with PUA-like domain
MTPTKDREMMARKKRYWLMKSEPGTYSIADLKRDGKTCWDGVRNYQARNLMRDEMQVGDGVLIYHSREKPMGVYGIAEIVGEAYPDDSAFDPQDKHYDPKSDPANPSWMMVDVGYVGTREPPVTLDMLKQTPGLDKMMVIQRGSRLSVQPVTKKEWDIVLGMSRQAP